MRQSVCRPAGRGSAEPIVPSERSEITGLAGPTKSTLLPSGLRRYVCCPFRSHTMSPRPLATLAAMTLAAFLPASAPAQQPTAPPNDTALTLPIQPVRTLHFTTDEATWISLDVSPDGKTIVFDIVGDLYTIPITGGTATRLTSGMAWDCMPRWSPDGRTVAFISDRDGGDNL